MSDQLRCITCKENVTSHHALPHLYSQTHAENEAKAAARSQASGIARPVGSPLIPVYTYREYTNFLPLYVWKESEVDRALHSLMAYRYVYNISRCFHLL